MGEEELPDSNNEVADGGSDQGTDNDDYYYAQQATEDHTPDDPEDYKLLSPYQPPDIWADRSLFVAPEYYEKQNSALQNADDGYDSDQFNSVENQPPPYKMVKM